MLDLKKPVSRTQPTDTLVRSHVVVIFDPVDGSLHGLLEAVELGPKKKFTLDAFPEPFDFTQRHRMVGTRSDVFDPILFHFLLKASFASPGQAESHDVAFTKTEQEYYSRTVKKKVVALANSELHSLSKKLLGL